MNGVNLIKQSTKNVLKLIYKKIMKNKHIEYEIDKIACERKNVFVFPSPSTPWGYMFQRPQQLALSLARKNNTVFYSVDGNYKYRPDATVKGIKKIERNLYLHNDFDGGKSFNNIDKVILWRYWASQDEYMKEFNNKLIQIYDWVDDVTVHNYDSKQLKIHEELLMKSDIVITTSNKLYEMAKKTREDAILLPNACDYEFFNKPQFIKWNEIDKIRKKSEVIIGYYGAIAEWFDFELIKACAEAYKNWTFLLVGPIYPNILDNKELNKYSNIVIWDRVNYYRLPYLLSKFDVAIIPFKINNITKATSPVKVYEYMAGGKVVVTTAMDELYKLKTVLIGNTKEEFIQKLKYAVELSKDDDYKKEIQLEAYSNSWENRVDILLEELRVRGLL